MPRMMQAQSSIEEDWAKWHEEVYGEITTVEDKGQYDNGEDMEYAVEITCKKTNGQGIETYKNYLMTSYNKHISLDWLSYVKKGIIDGPIPQGDALVAF